jgi:transposase-like protein
MGTQAERDWGERDGLTSEERARLKALERENRELRQANEIVGKRARIFAAAELDRRSGAATADVTPYARTGIIRIRG